MEEEEGGGDTYITTLLLSRLIVIASFSFSLSPLFLKDRDYKMYTSSLSTSISESKSIPSSSLIGSTFLFSDCVSLLGGGGGGGGGGTAISHSKKSQIQYPSQSHQYFLQYLVRVLQYPHTCCLL